MQQHQQLTKNERQKKQLPTMKLKNFCQVGSSFSLFLMKFPLRKKQEPNPTQPNQN